MPDKIDNVSSVFRPLEHISPSSFKSFLDLHKPRPEQRASSAQHPLEQQRLCIATMKLSLWAASLALITSYAAAQNEFFPYTLDLEWSSDAKADDCKASDRAAIDEKIFTHVNRVLSDSQYTTYKSLQIETQRRSLENEDRELCNGTKMCSRYCRYNWRVCNKLYNCGCRKRRDLSEPIYLAAGERELADLKAQLTSACQAALTPSSVKDKKCKDAMDTASCTVDLFGYESGNMADEFFPYTMVRLVIVSPQG